MSPSICELLDHASDGGPPDRLDLDAVIRAGVRTRRRRARVRAGGAVATMGVIGAVGLVGANVSTAPARVHLAPAATSSTPAPTSAALEPITNQGIAAILADQLPSMGITETPSVLAVTQYGTQLVRLTVDGPHGPGMFQVTVAPQHKPATKNMLPPATSSDGLSTVSIETRPDGIQIIILANTENCIQTTTVMAYHPATGTSVALDNATCLPWDGADNPTSKQLLTTEQAIRIVTDPDLAMSVPATVNEKGAERFPQLKPLT